MENFEKSFRQGWNRKFRYSFNEENFSMDNLSEDQRHISGNVYAESSKPHSYNEVFGVSTGLYR